MAKIKRGNNSFLHAPLPTKEPGQLSINVGDLFLTRFTPPWSRPPSLPAYTWRTWVQNQPVATVCREVLIASLESLDWKIIPRDMRYRDELSATIKYYTKFLEHGGEYIGTDWTGLLEWVVGDLLDLPFGGAAEIGRKNDDPNGRTLWVRPLDAGTLYPTLNLDFPVVQYYQTYNVIAFPKHAIARMFMSPSSYLFREGWGIAPPEKIYFAMELLNRGDKYYANLLLDIPTAGLLDLGDMSKESATDWIAGFKTFFNDNQTSSFKVPVLYEHTTKTEFIPFGKVPNDIMFDSITAKYAALVCGAYGVSLGDIGLESGGGKGGGSSLAGAIRQERRTRRTGFARVKSKTKYFLEQFLPDSLAFEFTDLDDELTVSLGRARLGSATAFNLLKQAGIFNAQEIRSQMIQDGIVSISIPEELPPDAKPALPAGSGAGKPPERPGVMGYPQPATGGGMGEVKSVTYKKKARNVDAVLNELSAVLIPVFTEMVMITNEDDILIAKSMVDESLFVNDALELQDYISHAIQDKKLIDFKYSGFAEELRSIADVTDHEVNQIKRNIENGITEFVGKTIAMLIRDVVFDNPLDTEYDSTVESIQENVEKSLPDAVKSFVSVQVEKFLHNKMEIKDES
jgi:hypothetical protein